MRQARDSFNGGEVSPYIASRLSVEKYHSGCRKLENATSIRYGGFRARAGFRLGGPAAASDVRMQGFNFDVINADPESFHLEFTANAIRFWREDGTQVMDGGSPYEIVSPWDATEMWQFDFAQKNDLIVFTHPVAGIHLLQRLGETNWTITPVEWKRRPWSDLQSTDTTVTISEPTSGNFLATLSNATLDASYVGSYIRVQLTADQAEQDSSQYDIWHPYFSDDSIPVQQVIGLFNGAAGDYDAALNSNVNTARVIVDEIGDFSTVWTCIQNYRFSIDYVPGQDHPSDYPAFFATGIVALNGIDVAGDAEFETTGTWLGIWSVQRSYDDGTSWETVKNVVSNEDNNEVVKISETIDNPAKYRVVCLQTADRPYASKVFFRVLSGTATDEVLITAVNSATEAVVTPTGEVELDRPSAQWSDDAFSSRNGYPAAVVWHEGSLWFGGTKDQPDRLWRSRTEDFFNFAFGTKADDAFSYVLNSNGYNSILWLISKQRLMVGTNSAEWASTTTDGGPISPETFACHSYTEHGSDPVPAQTLADAPVFIQREGRKIREFAPSPAGLGLFASPDVAELAEHITESGIKQMGRRQTPDTELIILRNDGQLAIMVWERSQNIYAWQRWQTDGVIKSFSTSWGPGEEDALFIAVERTINDVTSTFIEFIHPDAKRSEEAQAFDDVSYFDHSTGTPGNWVGLEYQAEIEPTPFEVGGHGNKLGYKSAHVRVRNTRKAKFSNSSRERFHTEDFKLTGPDGIDTQTVTIPGGVDRDNSIVIRSLPGEPLTVISIDPETNVGTS